VKGLSRDVDTYVFECWTVISVMLAYCVDDVAYIRRCQ